MCVTSSKHASERYQPNERTTEKSAKLNNSMKYALHAGTQLVQKTATTLKQLGGVLYLHGEGMTIGMEVEFRGDGRQHGNKESLNL